MFKRFITYYLISCLLILTTFSTETFSQNQIKNLNETKNLSTVDKNQKLDLKQVFAKEIAKSTKDKVLTDADFDKIEKDKLNASSKKKLSKKDKTWLVVFFVGLAVGVILLAKYVKPCLEGEDYVCEPDAFSDTQNCTCQ